MTCRHGCPFCRDRPLVDALDPHRDDGCGALLRRYRGERWEDLLPDGDDRTVSRALWAACSFGIPAADIAATIQALTNRTIASRNTEIDTIRTQAADTERFARFAADRLGHQLPAWQIDLADRILAGDRVSWPTGRRAGRATFAQLLHDYRHQPDRTDDD